MAGVREALDVAADHRNEERIRRGKRFRETVRKNRRHPSRVPFWLPGTSPRQLKRPVLHILGRRTPACRRSLSADLTRLGRESQVPAEQGTRGE